MLFVVIIYSEKTGHVRAFKCDIFGKQRLDLFVIIKRLVV